MDEYLLEVGEVFFHHAWDEQSEACFVIDQQHGLTPEEVQDVAMPAEKSAYVGSLGKRFGGQLLGELLGAADGGHNCVSIALTSGV